MAKISEDYDEGVEHKEDWDWFGLEEQADIVEKWFLDHYRGPGSASPTAGPNTAFGLASDAALNDQAFPYIRDHIRTGRN